MKRPRIALLSNPKSTGNLNQLPRIRAFCAEHIDIFHYEVERAEQMQQRRFTATRRAHYRHELTLVHVYRHAAKCRNIYFSNFV